MHLLIPQFEGIEVHGFHTHNEDDQAKEGHVIQAASDSQADSTRYPDTRCRGKTHHVTAGLHNDTTADETQATHYAGGDTGSIKLHRIRETILGNNHKQTGAHSHQQMRAHPGSLAAEFTLVTNDCANDSRRYQADTKF